MKIIVIGAGFGGMSAAALLAKSGHQVTVLEKHDMVGGRARVWKDKGFIFDIATSVWLACTIEWPTPKGHASWPDGCHQAI